MKADNQDKQIERVLRINYRFDNNDIYKSTSAIYVRHLDNDSTPATIKGETVK
ncbi:hypothetical protein [Lactobacillus jensenii]|uniref:hypothetical protein n=1 Tax=Lactobacillus jensenii TaxID=109790 RepID=UPI0016461A1F|nr:hypothetical protein [Lactobacillus jensenii]